MPDDLTMTDLPPDDILNEWDQELPLSTVDAPTEGIVPLGHDRGTFYYLSQASRQVVSLPAERHSRNTLMAMASVAHYWQRGRFVNAKGGILWDEAIDWLMGACRDVGIFDPDRLRGRGAWIDENRAVLHLGDKLLVDGDIRQLSGFSSRFIYEQARSLRVEAADEPLSAKRASRLMDLCMAAPWEDRKSMGRLLAGWCVIAPVCGAMPWRPHLWITSEAGGGKSWILDNIIRPLVGSIALFAQSKTSEAGLRGELGIDARPVVFDEFETQNDADRARVQQVLDLARQASSEAGADILKGTQTGGVRRYRIRSCFAFSSVNIGLTQAADESRTVVLTLRAEADKEIRAAAFKELKALHAEVMTPDFAAALLTRTLRLLPIIRQNAEMFAGAIARTGASRRTGDTLGVLLAGAWSLRSNKPATPDEADKFMADESWVKSAMSRNETDPEWQRALGHLAQQTIRVISGNGRSEDVPVGELVAAATGQTSANHPVSPQDAITSLIRAGIKILRDGDDILVALANTSSAVSTWFARTAWASGWLATIARSPGAYRANKTLAFGALRSKALILPVSVFFGTDDG